MNMNHQTVQTVAKRRNCAISHFLAPRLQWQQVSGVIHYRHYKCIYMNENLFKPIRTASERRLVRKSGKSLLNINFVMAASCGRAFCSSLPSKLPVKVSSSKSVCDKEENSDLESSSSTLSVEDSENIPPQFQVTLKRTMSVVVEQEDPRGQFPPKLQFHFLTPTTPSKLFLVYFVPFFMFADWDVQHVKAWTKALFNDEDHRQKIRGRTL